MRQFMLQSNKVAKIATCTITTGTTTDTSAYVDAKGFENVCVLSRVVSTTGDPTITEKLFVHTASTGTGTAIATVSWTAGTTGQIGGLQAPANIKGEGKQFFYVTVKAASGKAKVRNIYFLGGARHQPVSHITTVQSTTVAT